MADSPYPASSNATPRISPPASVVGEHVRAAIRTLRNTPGVALPVIAALAFATGLGVPLLGIVRQGVTAGPRYTHPLLREAPGATDWLRWTAERQPLGAMQSQAFGSLLWMTFALTLLLLGIALVNVVTLVLARGSARQPEMAMRTILGAMRRRLVGQLLSESALLAGIGIGLGLLLAWPGAYVLKAAWPSGDAPWSGTGMDGAVLMTVVGAFVVVTLLAWLSPARVAWSRDLRRFVAAGDRATGGPGEAAIRNVLAVLQIAASLVLLTTAGLLLRSFASQRTDDAGLGFDPHGTLTARVTLPGGARLGTARRAEMYEQAMARVRGVPGVVDTSIATTGSWLGVGATDRVTAVCGECAMAGMIKPVSEGEARVQAVGPRFFRTLGAPVVSGRELEMRDRAGAPRVAVISTAFAYRLFPNGEPLGKQIQVGGRSGEWYTVVGVVGEIHARGIGASSQPVPTLYLSALQHPPAAAGLAVRVHGDPARLASAVQRAVRGAVPGAKVTDGMTMDAYLASFAAPLRWFAVVFAALAGAALLLATTGLYAVMAYNVARRTREIGIRMALGARVADVTRLVLRQGLRLTVFGTVIGTMGALSVARSLELSFEGVNALDLPVHATIGATLAIVALTASLRPARRAASVDPQISLRAE
ncbi:MAG TPA: FtsX-like permease family protein [Longimicrobiaceae bacterium]|nr:FtsX-like permease family protein [Longimicrobiaceae bacterium]